jgi:hypothetical protein
MAEAFDGIPGVARWRAAHRDRYINPDSSVGRTSAASGNANNAVTGGVRTLLRLEGAAVLGISLAAYAQWGQGWGLFALLFLLPDMAFLAYLAGPGVGAAAYNASHAYLAALALLAAGLLGAQPLTLALGLIGCAHIGFDRMLGYGLKYSEGLYSTHLGQRGRGSVGQTDPW